MKDTVITTTINSIKNPQITNTGSNIWIWISAIEFIFIVCLILYIKGKPKDRLNDKTELEEVDFNNIIKSSFLSSNLYNKLKVKCHPDRFPCDPHLNREAENLFQEIEKNKTNLTKLEELRTKAIKTLKIKI